MTKVIDFGDFWIEVFNMVRVNVANNTNRFITFTLDKPGRFVGGGGFTDASSILVHGPQITTAVGNEILYGDAITEISLRVRNSSGSAQDIGAHAIIILKK